MDSVPGGAAYLVAGYLLTWVVLVGYAWRLERRARDADRALQIERPADGGAEGRA